MSITKQQRNKCEQLIIKYFDALDKSKTNSDYYKKVFADMSDAQFEKWLKKDWPIRFQQRLSATEPSMTDIKNSLDAIGVPMMEKITMPLIYKDKDGNKAWIPIFLTTICLNKRGLKRAKETYEQRGNTRDD